MTSLLLPTLGRYLRWARSAAPFRLNALLGRVGAMRFHMNGGHVPKPLLRPGQFRIKMVFLNAQLFSKMPYYRRAAKRPRYGKRRQVLYPAESIGGKHRGEPYIGRRHRSCYNY